MCAVNKYKSIQGIVSFVVMLCVVNFPTIYWITNLYTSKSIYVVQQLTPLYLSVHTSIAQNLQCGPRPGPGLAGITVAVRSRLIWNRGYGSSYGLTMRHPGNGLRCVTNDDTPGHP